jgi:hypothetical protein
VFVLLLFRELPETNLITLIGLLHTSYRAVLLVAGWLRSYLHRVWQKFLATYIPILYHLFTHLYAGWMAVSMQQEKVGEIHDAHELPWMIGGALLLGVLIFVGEWMLHRNMHCATHHQKAHQHCHDGECEETHT